MSDIEDDLSVSAKDSDEETDDELDLEDDLEDDDELQEPPPTNEFWPHEQLQVPPPTNEPVAVDPKEQFTVLYGPLAVAVNDCVALKQSVLFKPASTLKGINGPEQPLLT